MPPIPSSLMMWYRGLKDWPTRSGPASSPERRSPPPMPVAAPVGSDPIVEPSWDAPNVAPSGSPVVSIGMTPVATDVWKKLAPHAVHRLESRDVALPQRGQIIS